MNAIVYRRYGSPSMLHCEEIAKPTPGPGDVLVRVHASSLNAADLEYLHGTPFVARMGSGLLRPRRRVLGFDVSGTVVEAGADVTRFVPGDTVRGDLTECGFGAFAEVAGTREEA